MERKVWVGALGVVVAAGALCAGYVTWEAREWDRYVSGYVLEENDFVKDVVFTETARTWRTRTFSLTAEFTNGLSASWTGKAQFGFGTRTELSLDLTRGIGKDLEKGIGIDGFKDRLLVETSVLGSVKPIVWELDPFAFEDKAEGLACSFEGTRVTGEEKAGEIRARLSLAGMSCAPLLEAGQDSDAPETRGDFVKNVSAEVVMGKKPIADLKISAGAFKSGELSAAGFKFSAASEKSSPSAGGKSDEPVRWDERMTFEVLSPKIEGESADRIALDMTLTRLSEPLLVQIATASRAAADPDAALQLFSLWSNAFMRDGVTLEVNDGCYVRGKDEATLKGRIAYGVADQRLSWGSFSLAIPEKLVSPATAAVYTAEGDLKLVSGVYQAKIDLFDDGIYVNDAPRMTWMGLLSLN